MTTVRTVHFFLTTAPNVHATDSVKLLPPSSSTTARHPEMQEMQAEALALNAFTIISWYENIDKSLIINNIIQWQTDKAKQYEYENVKRPRLESLFQLLIAISFFEITLWLADDIFEEEMEHRDTRVHRYLVRTKDNRNRNTIVQKLMSWIKDKCIMAIFPPRIKSWPVGSASLFYQR